MKIAATLGNILGCRIRSFAAAEIAAQWVEVGLPFYGPKLLTDMVYDPARVARVEVPYHDCLSRLENGTIDAVVWNVENRRCWLDTGWKPRLWKEINASCWRRRPPFNPQR
ncbi:hypothetical protein J4732_13455 [Serratia marcescens]|uniref:Uncharacterized protein n=1 Tax=Serratia marcescens TaxID=615 RepID=A0A939NP79_SERMA|nr:hypothetical protein [Serratia marcescens]